MKVNVNNLTPVSEADSSELIAELYSRGVELTNIFGRYYEFDEMATMKGYNPLLTVEDAELTYGRS